MRLIFQISLLLLVCLSSIILAGAEEFALPLATIPVAVLAWWIVDYKKIVSLNFWLAAVLALVALLMGVFEFRSFREQSALGAGGHVLSYLTWIYLCRNKDSHTYLWIFALCLMQVAVASLLTFSLWYGIGLLTFSLLATWTMSLFLLYRSQFVKQSGEEKLSEEIAQSYLVRSPIGPLWNSVSKGPQTNLFGFGYVSNLFATFLMSMMVGSLFFFLVPRFTISTTLASPMARASQAVSGFSNQVRLGDIGEVLEDATEVMSVEFFQVSTGQKLNEAETLQLLGNDPLFRGAVLERYDNSIWEHDQSEEFVRINHQRGNALYKMQVEIQPVTRGTLFSPGRFMSASPVDATVTIENGLFSNLLRASYKTSRGSNFKYDVFIGRNHLVSYGPGQPPQISRSIPELNSSNFMQPAASFLKYRSLNLEVPKSCQDLVRVTNTVTRGSQNATEIANKLLDWFTESGGFTYSTQLSIHDSNLDPLVDFVLNRKTGHCEYYASAMALMLRTKDIPARVITGYKGGTWNKTAQVLVVQQLHAHAWVEALIDNQWVVLDPTPSTREEEIEKFRASNRFLAENWLAAEMIWSRLTGLTQETQRDRIYMPVLEAFTDISHSLMSLGESSSNLLSQSGEFLRNPSRWISVQGGVVAAVVMLLLVGMFFGGKLVWSLWKRWLNHGHSQKEQPVDLRRVVPFYQRFLSILGKKGINQLPSQTATEFVNSAAIQMEPLLHSPLPQAWPDQIVRMFNQVRFGEKPLTVAELEQIESSISALEKAFETEAQRSAVTPHG